VTGLAGLLALVLAQEPPVFRTRVELVYVDVFVTKKDAPVSGLEAGDFRVEDNGVAQRVEVVDRKLVPTTAVLALDASASVAGGNLVHLKEAARAFLAGLGERDEAALVTFNEKLLLREGASRDLAAVSAALDRVRPRGGTSLIDALYVCLKRRWGTGRPLVVLFTDGQDSASWLENDDILQAARESSALLHVVKTESLPTRVRAQSLPSVRTDPSLRSHGFASESGAMESGYVYLLRRAAETTDGAYWPVESMASLPAAFLRILEASAARYVLRYEPTGVSRTGRHRPKVSVRRRGVDVRARQEYMVPTAPPQ
jgi:VWFA-related protein